MSIATLPIVCTTDLAPTFVGIVDLQILATGEAYFIALVTATGPGLEGLVESLASTIAAHSGAKLTGHYRAEATYLGGGDYSLVVRSLNA